MILVENRRSSSRFSRAQRLKRKHLRSQLGSILARVEFCMLLNQDPYVKYDKSSN